VPARIVVVGAGVVGACVALRLAQSGAEVTVLEAASPGEGTSGTSFAWIDASHKSLDPYVELNIAGLEGWRRMGEELGHPYWLTLTGTLTWETDPAAAAALADQMASLRERGYSAEALGREEVAELEPDLVVDDGVETISYYPDEGYLMARPAIGALLALGAEDGVELRSGAKVTGFETRGDAVTGVRLASGELIEADVVVTCVGRWTEELMSLVDVELPLTPHEPDASLSVGLLVLSKPVLSRLSRVVFANGLMLRPDGGGRLLLHGDEQDRRVRWDSPMSPLPPEAEELIGLARERLRRADAALVESAYIGIRALPIDHMPAVGQVREGLYTVVTHSGVTLAPTLGDLVSGEILQGDQSDALARFRPARFEGAIT
jgi:glycine/D-amino acid oxidase-like deaminating enzyme